MAKVVCVLYDDPIDGYPPKYARDNIPKITKYPDGQTAPTPSKIDFKPGELLGSVSGELGLRKFLEDAGHTLVVTSSKDGEDSVLDKELPEAEIVISQPFWPAYMTKERFDKAKKLKLIITAGIGSDHTDLQAAMDKGVTVAEVTYSNSISVAEHIVMMILALVRNYIPSYGWVIKGGPSATERDRAQRPPPRTLTGSSICLVRCSSGCAPTTSRNPTTASSSNRRSTACSPGSIRIRATWIQIRVKSVRSHSEGDDVGYIRVTKFNEQSTDGLKKAISDLTSQLGADRVKGFVIDLRNNPGGLLDQAISVSDAFLDKGDAAAMPRRPSASTLGRAT